MASLMLLIDSPLLGVKKGSGEGGGEYRVSNLDFVFMFLQVPLALVSSVNIDGIIYSIS